MNDQQTHNYLYERWIRGDDVIWVEGIKKWMTQKQFDKLKLAPAIPKELKGFRADSIVLDEINYMSGSE